MTNAPWYVGKEIFYEIVLKIPFTNNIIKILEKIQKMNHKVMESSNEPKVETILKKNW